MNKKTKKVAMLLIIKTIIVVSSNACKKDCQDDGRLAQEEIPVTEKIKGIIVEGPWDITITQDSTYNSAMLEYSTSETNRISTKLHPNGYLHIKIDTRGNWNSNCKVLRAKINAATLENIEAAGAATIWTYGYFGSLNNIVLSGASTINGLKSEGTFAELKLSGASTLKGFTFTGNGIDVNLSGASHMSLNHIDANLCRIDASGASTFEGTGYASTTDFSGSGASTFRTFDLESENLDIDLSGASDAKVTVNNVIKGKLTGASTLKYKKATDVSKVTATGASKIIRVD